MIKVVRKAEVKKWFFWWVVGIVLISLPFIISEFWTLILTEILAYCIFALGYNIVLGYGGMIPFGNAAFYGVGAYVVAILITKTKVSLWIALSMAPLLALLVGLVIGLLTIRFRAFYFAIITLAFGELVYSVIFKWYDLTGGENGIIGIALPEVLSTTTNMYFFVLGITVSCVYVIYRIVDSPFGRTLIAARENPQRAESMGINLNSHRLIAFVTSAFFAGLSGGMHAVIVRGAFPDLTSWVKSGEVLLTVLLGGMHTFFGPIIGVGCLFFVQIILGSLTIYWPTILGVLFILFVLFMPKGVTGYIQKWLTVKVWPT